MRVRRHDPTTFLAGAWELLGQHEAVNSLLFGLGHTLARQSNTYGDEPPYLVTIEDQGRAVLAAICTPPRSLVLSLPWASDATSGAVEALVSDVAAQMPRLPGVQGPGVVARAFVRRWTSRTKQESRLLDVEHVYELDTVVMPPRPPGRMRRATGTDRPLLAAWLAAFFAEAEPAMPLPSAAVEQTLRQRLEASDAGLYLWEDTSPVSLAGYAGPTPTGIRVGPVYTPPGLRGRGYASALVAELSQNLLDGGRDRCFLFADAANPTSNRIYQRVGYRRVGSALRYALSDPNRPSFPRSSE